jgi:transcriptional regulator with XRE-family HTH domain
VAIIIASPDEVCAALGVQVRQLRLARNLSQAELGARAGVSFGAVRKLESSGQTTLATFVRCVQALGAGGDLETVLKPPARSIAELEQQHQATLRQRARKPAGPHKKKVAGQP